MDNNKQRRSTFKGSSILDEQIIPKKLAKVPTIQGEPVESPIQDKSSKVAKKKKDKGKKKKGKGKKKKKRATNRADEQISPADILIKTPEVANLFLKVLGQDISSNEDPKVQEKKSLQRLSKVVDDEYEHTSESSYELSEGEPSLRPSQTIQENIVFSIGGDPVIIQLPNYNLSGDVKRVFRQQNGQPVPKFTSITNRGLYIQTDDPKDKGRYFLELVSTIRQDLTDTQYFTLVVSDPNDSNQTTSMDKQVSRDSVKKQDKINGQNTQQNKTPLLEITDNNNNDNMWNDQFQSKSCGHYSDSDESAPDVPAFKKVETNKKSLITNEGLTVAQLKLLYATPKPHTEVQVPVSSRNKLKIISQSSQLEPVLSEDDKNEQKSPQKSTYTPDKKLQSVEKEVKRNMQSVKIAPDNQLKFLQDQQEQLKFRTSKTQIIYEHSSITSEENSNSLEQSSQKAVIVEESKQRQSKTPLFLTQPSGGIHIDLNLVKSEEESEDQGEDQEEYDEESSSETMEKLSDTIQKYENQRSAPDNIMSTPKQDPLTPQRFSGPNRKSKWLDKMINQAVQQPQTQERSQFSTIAAQLQEFKQEIDANRQGVSQPSASNLKNNFLIDKNLNKPQLLDQQQSVQATESNVSNTSRARRYVGELIQRIESSPEFSPTKASRKKEVQDSLNDQNNQRKSVQVISPITSLLKKETQPFQSQTPKEISDTRIIPSVEYSFSPQIQRYSENFQNKEVNVDKNFISFSAMQDKNHANGSRSPIRQLEDPRSFIKNYQSDFKDFEPRISTQVNDLGYQSNSSLKYEVENNQELSHNQKIKQRTERVRDKNKASTTKNSNQPVVPLSEQRENRRRSRGERANQSTASPINNFLSDPNHKYFKEGSKFSDIIIAQNNNQNSNYDGFYDDANESDQQQQQLKHYSESTQQYDNLMATLNSIQSESLKQSFVKANQLDQIENDNDKSGKTRADQKGQLQTTLALTREFDTMALKKQQTYEESSDINSVQTQKAEMAAQIGSHNGKASLKLLIDYNYRKAEKQNQKLRNKIQKVKLQLQVEDGILPGEFTRGRMNETMGLFDLLHEKEEYEVNKQIQLQIEQSSDRVRKMQSMLQNADQERFFIIQATQLEAQKTQADEELLLKSYLYDAISQTQNLKLKCNFLSDQKRRLQDKIDTLLSEISTNDDQMIYQEHNHLALMEQELSDVQNQILQNSKQIKTLQSETESLVNLNQALTSQVKDFQSQLESKQQEQDQLLSHGGQVSEKQLKMEAQIENNSLSIVQMNNECEQMCSEVQKVWEHLQQENKKLQSIKKQIDIEQKEGLAQQLNQQLEQQKEFLNQQRSAQLRAITQAEIDNENWRLEMEFQRQKELIKLTQQMSPKKNNSQRKNKHMPDHMQQRTNNYINNRDEKNVVSAWGVARDNSPILTPIQLDKSQQHTPIRDKSVHTPTRRYTAPENHSIFGGNDDLPDSMRFTTTYRQFANNQKFTGKKEGEDGGSDLLSIQQPEAWFTRFGTQFDLQEKAPQKKELSASRERLVNEGQDMAMLLRPGSLTPQNTFKFGSQQKFLSSPVNKKMITQLPKLREQLTCLQEQRQLEIQTDKRVKLDQQIVFCENRIMEIENKISIL